MKTCEFPPQTIKPSAEGKDITVSNTDNVKIKVFEGLRLEIAILERTLQIHILYYASVTHSPSPSSSCVVDITHNEWHEQQQWQQQPQWHNTEALHSEHIVQHKYAGHESEQ